MILVKIMQYDKFKNILNSKIFENSKIDLIEKIANYPDRYIGLFRPTKPKAKILQNLLQSNKIRFGDALETLFEEYFKELGYKNLNKLIKDSNDNNLNLDQLFTDNNYIYFVEQKVRDDHDSSKKRGQIENFENKIISLLKVYKEKELRTYTYFIDPSLMKNKNYYFTELKKIENDYNVSCKLCYGKDFWVDINHEDIWDEILKYLEKWKNEIPEMPSINFDENPTDSFESIKDMKITEYRKLFNNKQICKEILPILFPDKKTLILLKDYFKQKDLTIYKTMADKIDLYL